MNDFLNERAPEPANIPASSGDPHEALQTHLWEHHHLQLIAHSQEPALWSLAIRPGFHTRMQDVHVAPQPFGHALEAALQYSAESFRRDEQALAGARSCGQPRPAKWSLAAFRDAWLSGHSLRSIGARLRAPVQELLEGAADAGMAPAGLQELRELDGKTSLERAQAYVQAGAPAMPGDVECDWFAAEVVVTTLERRHCALGWSLRRKSPGGHVACEIVRGQSQAREYLQNPLQGPRELLELCVGLGVKRLSVAHEGGFARAGLGSWAQPISEAEDRRAQEISRKIAHLKFFRKGVNVRVDQARASALQAAQSALMVEPRAAGHSKV